MLRQVIDRQNTGSEVWADSTYRSQSNEAWLDDHMLTSRIHRRKPKGKSMPIATARTNAAKSSIRARIEHVFAHPRKVCDHGISLSGIPGNALIGTAGRQTQRQIRPSTEISLPLWHRRPHQAGFSSVHLSIHACTTLVYCAFVARTQSSHSTGGLRSAHLISSQRGYNELRHFSRMRRLGRSGGVERAWLSLSGMGEHIPPYPHSHR